MHAYYATALLFLVFGSSATGLAATRAVLTGCCVQGQAEPIALTGIVPSQTIVKSAYLGSDLSEGFYDAKHNLLVIAGVYQIDVVTYPSLTLKSTIPIQTFAVTGHGGVGYSLGVAYLNLVGSIDKFDPSTGSILGQLTLPNYLNTQAGPNGSAISRSGKYLYVFYDYIPVGDDVENVIPPGTSTMYVIDTDSMSIVAQWVNNYGFPSGVALSGLGSSGYYSTYSIDDFNNGSAVLLKANLATGSVSQTLQFSDTSRAGASGPVLSPDKSIIYLSVGYELYAVDAATFTIVTQVSLVNPAGISLSPDGRYLYLVSAFYGYTILDSTTLATVGTIPSNYIYPQSPIFVP